MAKEKKSFVLRIEKEILDAVEKWASDEFRSTNGQLEWIIVNALKREKRYKKEVEKKES
ncbi:MAG: Arc family DNA-binding protein [Rikenellaceae bacterium]|nr:Arc family DNA-binding protein [Rikenellaceae bacterium]